MNAKVTPSVLPDAAARARALDPAASFLVQAPAGSGKTELLVQRFLRLLSVVDEPEEILAVTFTRKAAAEMRSRIISALECARGGRIPEAEHLKAGYELARAAIARERERGWRLDEQAARLRISTIDSVNSWLANRSPLVAGRLSQLRVTEDCEALYEQAARETVSLVVEPGELGTAVRRLLEHFDNRAETVTRLIARMLEHRDQWLRHLGTGEASDAQRANLEHSLQLLIEMSLQRLEALLAPDLRSELAELAAYAGTHIRTREPDSDLARWDGHTDFPLPVAGEVARWRGIAQLLLTKSGEWRKRTGLDVRAGFPPDNRDMKERMGDLLETLQQIPGLLDVLRDIALLSDPYYPDVQWEALKALIRVLPVAAALLQEVFSAQGQTDFGQVAAEALASLADPEGPTELGLMLDYRLSHILMDEYQDTSRSQAVLLHRLTAGWEQGDGRSLFLVGDPMQSIYRFREAEVGVYLETRANGVGHLRLEFLQLETNFRSDPVIVDWVNSVFAQLMPVKEDAMTGAVPYAASRAYHPPDPGARVVWHSVSYKDRDAEARAVLEVVRDCSTRWPEQDIGILVRSRAHAAALIPLLQAAGIVYAAPELEHMAEEPVVQDLLALTRALVHRADRIAWLAVLRAPWCGLTLADLHALAASDHQATVCELIADAAVTDRLSEDGRTRVGKCMHQLLPWIERRGSCSLRELVEGAWLCLGGPAVVGRDTDLEVAEAWFAYLERMDRGGDCPDIVEMIDGLASQTVSRPRANARVHIMTMHKAKGLEFDTVLLPGLGYPTRGASREMLIWTELAGYGDEAPLVLAPLNAHGDDQDRIYELLRNFEKCRAEHELDRLLYVATTRARRRLHLFAALQANGDGDMSPRSGTLLHRLWPAVSDQLSSAEISAEATEDQQRNSEQNDGKIDWFEPSLYRLPADWSSPLTNAGADGAREPVPERPEFDWASRWSMHVGSVVHLWLEEIARAGVERFDRSRLANLPSSACRLLTRLGVPAHELERATARVVEAIEACLDDETGRWLLSSSHREATSELAVDTLSETGFEMSRIDRCFVTEQGERWIVDYKTSTHEGAGLAAFLESEAIRYRPQLRRYRDALQSIEPMPTRTALYFPLLRVLHEVDVDA